ncbi:MAG: imidazoleglycerol-phosphate dehydratase HisB [Chloroflexota bacterium]|nr:imidazoleglycerol-phosphate dehydratase HisB [Chloroflexota bacterium]
MEARMATVQRDTRETKVSVEINLDGTGQYSVNTGNGFFDHLLSQLARHSLMDLTVKAEGDADQTGWHHTVEDVSIAVGRALNQALGDGRGIMRMGHSMVPFDETLVRVAVDLSGRSYAIVETAIEAEMVESLPADLVRHSLESIAMEGRFNLHAAVLTGQNAHHKAEALYKALARALRQAITLDPRQSGEVPSTKGTISG